MMKKLFFLLLVTSLFLINVHAQPVTWQSRGVGGGGALFSPSINPADKKEFYVACDMSELFHTKNFGQQYDLVPFKSLQAGNNSKVVFTATGTLYTLQYANDAVIPMKSSDNGISWAPLSGNPDSSEPLYSIFADYKNAGRIIIATYGNIYFSANGGSAFTNIHNAASSATGNIIAGVFFDGNTIYIGTNDGLLVSTNAGANWSTASLSGIPAGQAIWSFCGAKVNNTTKFFCITALSGDIYAGKPGSDYYNFPKGIYSCTYGKTNWVSKSTFLNFATHFPFFIDMAENDTSTVFAAGSSADGVPLIARSLNSGNSWTPTTFNTANNQNIITGWSGQGGDRGWGYGECAMGFDVAMNDASTLIFSDFGYVHTSSDMGNSWKQAYVEPADQNPANAATPAKKNYHSIGLENTTNWQICWIDSLNLFAAFSDIKGIRSTDGGVTWSFNYSGHNGNSMYKIEKGKNGTLYAATSDIHDMYQSTRLADNLLDAADNNGKLIYSTDKGLNWTLLHNFGHPVFWIALDPVNVNRAYASVIHYNGGTGTGGIYRCDNLNNLAASTWTLLPNPPRTEKHPASLAVLNDGKLVATYSGRRTTAGFTASSGCFIYNPANNTWTDVSDPGMQYWTKDITVDPNDPLQNTWYVSVFSGWGGNPNGKGGLYKTTNRGQNWTRVSALDRVTSCTFNPKNKDEIYLTTEQEGLWTCSNINAVSPIFKQVANYPFRQPERVFFNPYKPSEVWVTSFGNGMKTGNLPTVTGISAQDFPVENPFSFYPNPATSHINIQRLNYQVNTAVISDMSGCEISAVPVQNSGNESVIDLSDVKVPGLYFIRLGEKRIKISIER